MNIYRQYGKRLIDLVLGSISCAVLAPVHGVVALMVLITSGRPVYYSQERIGSDGEPFQLHKFRTMKVGTHEASGGYPTASMVTPIGSILRRTSLDELPQLWNIVRGDMSIVGPRPALRDQVDRYTAAQRRRLSVRPGLTGLAQVKFRNDAPWSRRIEADLEYIDALSLRNDLRIIARTIPVALRGSTVLTGQTMNDVDDLGR